MWREEKKPAATLSVHGQGRGPAGARAHSPQRPPRRPPTSFLRGKAPPVNPRTTGRRQNGSPSAAGRRTRGRPEPTATAHTARAHPPEGRHGTCARRTRRRPSPRGGGARLTRPPRPTPNELPQDPTRRHRGGDRRRGRWGWERHTTARPRAPEGQPGALQEHRKRPRQSQRSCNAREGSTTGRRDSTPTAAEGGGPRGDNHKRRKRGVPAASEDPADPRRTPRGRRRGRDSKVRPGSAPQCLPTHRSQAGTRDRGPPRAGREERVPFTMNGRPSPAAARSRPGRARHHHINQGKQPRSGVGRSVSHSLPGGQRADQPDHPQLRGRGGRQPGRDEERLTRTARSQREWGCHGRPRCPQQGARSGRVSPRRLPRRPRVGQRPGPKAAPGVGTLRRTRDQAHTGPSRRLQHEQGRLAGSPGGPEAHHASRGPTSPATSRQRTACQQ